MLHEFKGTKPQLHESVFVAEGAEIIGNVTAGEGASFWFNVVARGDVHWIRIGDNTNIQDGTVLHVTDGKYPLSIGKRVTVGHMALLHGCTVEDDCLIGMGSIVMDDAVIGAGSIVAAGSMVTPGKRFPPGSMIMGRPAKVVRQVSPEERAEMIDYSWVHYRDLARDYPTR